MFVIVGTPYEGGIFRCKLVVDSEFPYKPPKGKFTEFWMESLGSPFGSPIVLVLSEIPTRFPMNLNAENIKIEMAV